MSQSITLDEYHDAVVNWFKSNEKLTWIKTVAAYPELEAGFQTPAIFFGIPNWSKAESQKTNGQKTYELDCQVLLVMDMSREAVQKEIRNAAMLLNYELDDQRFGLKTKGSQVTSSEEDAFNPELDDYVVWSVRYTHEVEVGAIEGALLAEIFDLTARRMVGYTPNVGNAHKDDYEQVYPEPEVK
ncbi:hypothetical protein F0223_21615 [Vibrio coralliilyticus]|uniref:hypothetical protein n=1 Tax=Vibrio coralliilyticus TaxID=190893 RepID=UPI00148E43D6|nr:hypothetical protein [Vibrio coralliilyticus]NOI20825.1 hypothetical protein [Vibrio coralliilyticus]